VRTKLFMVVASAALILGGCATTADYSGPVSRLEQAINDSAASIVAIDADITTRQNAKLKNHIVAGNLLLDPANDQCAAGKENCTLTVLEAKDGKTILVSSYPLESSMPNGLKALQMVKIYIGRLKSIIEADTTAKVSANANATLGSLEEIANKLAKENGNSADDTNKITEYKEPARSLIEWATEKYVERVKVNALARATSDAHKVIKDLTVFYATAAQSQKLAEFAGFHAAFVKEQEQFDGNTIAGSSVDTYVQAAANYEVALKAQSANPLKAFEVAHEKLMKQLNGKEEKKTTLADVASAIERLEQECKKIKALVDGFKKKSNSTTNGDQS
jgi:hypothetical protein